eukprot:TRINITY_DN12017_c0_g1_i1.p1 TRINITY_DN12017_c0_g1~~TRINITY_DN12017_c0_g1_i1.p1  ORF type:complete len:682 (+),score=115.79 TRINITY_DN12017_c0_g1_i1:493-2538(+)
MLNPVQNVSYWVYNKTDLCLVCGSSAFQVWDLNNQRNLATVNLDNNSAVNSFVKIHGTHNFVVGATSKGEIKAWIFDLANANDVACVLASEEGTVVSGFEISFGEFQSGSSNKEIASLHYNSLTSFQLLCGDIRGNFFIFLKNTTDKRDYFSSNYFYRIQIVTKTPKRKALLSGSVTLNRHSLKSHLSNSVEHTPNFRKELALRISAVKKLGMFLVSILSNGEVSIYHVGTNKKNMKGKNVPITVDEFEIRFVSKHQADMKVSKVALFEEARALVLYGNINKQPVATVIGMPRPSNNGKALSVVPMQRSHTLSRIEKPMCKAGKDCNSTDLTHFACFTHTKSPSVISIKEPQQPFRIELGDIQNVRRRLQSPSTAPHSLSSKRSSRTQSDPDLASTTENIRGHTKSASITLPSESVHKTTPRGFSWQDSILKEMEAQESAFSSLRVKVTERIKAAADQISALEDQLTKSENEQRIQAEKIQSLQKQAKFAAVKATADLKKLENVVKERDSAIEQQNATIAQQNETIEKLRQQLVNEKVIEEKNEKIAALEKELEGKAQLAEELAQSREAVAKLESDLEKIRRREKHYYEKSKDLGKELLAYKGEKDKRSSKKNSLPLKHSAPTQRKSSTTELQTAKERASQKKKGGSTRKPGNFVKKLEKEKVALAQELGISQEELSKLMH